MPGPCGWARPGLGTYAVTAAARNGKKALVLVDDAETRADLVDLLRTLANGGSPLPVRVVVLTRELDPWWQSMFDRLSPAEQEVLSPRLLELAPERRDRPSPRALAIRSLHLPTSNAPTAPYLSSRVRYGLAITS